MGEGRLDLSLAAMDAIAQRIASTLDLAAVLAQVTGLLVAETGVALARIWLVDGEALVLRASSGLSTRLDGGHARVPRNDPRKIADIARTRRAVLTNELLDDPRILDKAWVRREGLASFAAHPLLFRNELLGVVAVFARRPMTDEDLAGLGLLARWSAIAVQNARLFAEVDGLRARLQAENAYLKEQVDEDTETIGESAPWRALQGQLRQVAKTDTTVLIVGETGTGKELVARAVHAGSARHGRALVKVNCAAVPANLVESELFGHERGAFTGADKRRIGRFELADRGTLFLDEVGELPAEAQAKLLRALQEREIERVGGDAPIHVDVRVVAATNRDLEADVRSGRFRADLYYRLAVFPLRVPPLRDRRDDVPLLVDRFVQRQARRLGKPLRAVSQAALERLVAYDWPGNVRELQNVIERAAILSPGPVVDVDVLPMLTRAGATEAPAPPAPGSLVEVERRHIEGVLDQRDWVIEGAGGAAAALGVRASTLRSRMAKLGIRRPR